MAQRRSNGSVDDRWTMLDRSTGERVKSARWGKGLRYRARYRAVDHRQHTSAFATKREANNWLRRELAALDSGAWARPSDGNVTFRELAEAWHTANGGRIKPSTHARYRGLLDGHVLPTWGTVSVNRIGYEGVRRWVVELSASGLSASSVRQAYRVLSLVLADAVKAGRVRLNPAAGVELPRAVSREAVFLSASQVHRLADTAERLGMDRARKATPTERARMESAARADRALLLFLAYTGLRFGEAAALRVRRLDLLRRRLTVAESVTEVAGRAVFTAPKTHAVRTAPVVGLVADLLAELLDGKGPDDLVFTSPTGDVLRINNWRHRVFDPAVRAAGLDGLTPHGLRHTAASLAVASGATVKHVQAMLGHKSATMTLDVYAGLFADGLDDLAARLDASARASEDQMRTEAAERASREQPVSGLRAV